MASTVTQQMNISFLGKYTAQLKTGQKSTIRNIASSMTLRLRDSFSTVSADSVIRRTVEKMQAAINVSLSDVIGRDRYFEMAGSRTLTPIPLMQQPLQPANQQPAYQPTEAEINAGGRARSPRPLAGRRLDQT